MPCKINLTGRTFGRFVVVEESPKTGRTVRRWCRCACGSMKAVAAANLQRGHTSSCGCLRREQLATRNRTHGRAGSPTHRTWKSLLTRCTNPKYPGYVKYGARGITVCERWRSFENFLADVGERPPGTTLDRIDNDGPYAPENCRWASLREQSLNKRSNRRVTLEGVTLTVLEWCERLGRKRATVYDRLRLGWPIERALSEPVRDSQS